MKILLSTFSIHESLPFFILVFSILFILCLGLVHGQKQKQYSTALKTKAKYKKHVVTLYRRLKQSPLTRKYIDSVSYQYRFISPCDESTIATKTLGTCVLSLSLSLCVLWIIYLSNQSFITLIIAACAVYIVNSEVVGRVAKLYELSVLDGLDKMISEVIHYYYIEYRVDDAIYRARENTITNMKLALHQIYELLLSDDKEEALRDYYEQIPNKYLRSFVNQCIGAMEGGEQLQEGRVLFIRNLENLQREIEIEREKLQRLYMEFFGVILCVVAPIFCIQLVKDFSISLKENMASFYYGRIGYLLDLGLVITILTIYAIMRKSAEYSSFQVVRYPWLESLERIASIKKGLDNYEVKYATKMERLKRDLRNYGHRIRARQFILRSMVLALLLGIGTLSITHYLHQNKRKQLQHITMEEIQSYPMMIKENQYQIIKQTIESLVKELTIEGKTVPTEDVLIRQVSENSQLYKDEHIKYMVNEILQRVDEYHREYLTFLDFVVAILMGGLAYYLPFLLLNYHKAASVDAMEDEVHQFHALISMLMFIDGISVKQILVELESFANVFKQSLQHCINDYSSGDVEALEALKEREPFEPYRRMIDNFLRCDDMPIHQAFHEINIDKDGYMGKRKLANEKSLRKRVMRAYVLAALPFFLLFSYGIVPTLLASMAELNAMISELQHSPW